MSLILKNVRKTYREPNGHRLPVLGIEHYELAQGEQASLVGSSGGGKTTLLNIISGILTPDSGEVIVDGKDIARLPEFVRDQFRASRIGFVFQTFNLLPAFTALENVLLGMSFSGRPVDRNFALSFEAGGAGASTASHTATHVGWRTTASLRCSLAGEQARFIAGRRTDGECGSRQSAADSGSDS